MRLQARRPPGHGKRKALAYAADILSLRAQGHSLAAIREALDDVGVVVSINTVRREALRGPPAPAVRESGISTSPSVTPRPGAEVPPSHDEMPLQGKALAEDFMRDRLSPPLFLKEPSK